MDDGWEQRMAERAAARRVVEHAERAAAEAAAQDNREAAELAAQIAVYDAGPPCGACYQWLPNYLPPYGHHWEHIGTHNVGERDRACRCDCHPAEQRWGPTFIA